MRHPERTHGVGEIRNLLSIAAKHQQIDSPRPRLALVYAALEREMARFQEAVRRRLGSGPTGPVELVLAHIEEALAEDDAATQMAAFLITALVHAPDMLGPVRRLYSALLDPLRSEHGEFAEARHALLAVEGIFLLRGLGFAEVSADELKSVLLHARNIVLAVLDRSA